MKIGIVGTGNMGRVVGLALAERGHEVFFGARNIEKAARAASFSRAGVQFGSNDQAAEFGEVVFYSPRDTNPCEVLSDVAALDGKIVIDAHNGIMPAGYEFELIRESRAEKLQRQIPRARVVKAFNTITQELLEYANRGLDTYRVACFIASDHAEASKLIAELAGSLGFVPLDCGGLRQARLIEGAADLLRMLLYMQKSPWSSFTLTSVPPVYPGRFGGREPSGLPAAMGATAGSRAARPS